MTNEAVKEYVLGHDSAETKRLNLQHEAFVSSAGFLLHPRIMSSLKNKSPHVADIATGTGAWLLALEEEIGKSSSDWTLSGLDISAGQFPPESNSSKCQFSILDIREPIPAEMKGCFDVVHIRMILGGLTTPDWTVVAKNVHDLLKPGGFLQWHEIDATTIQAFPGIADPMVSTKSSEALVNACVSGFQQVGRFMQEDMPMLKDRVETAGFVGTEVLRPSSDRDPRMRQQASLAMWEAVSTALKFLIKGGASTEVEAETAERLSQESRKELEADASYWRWDMYILTAQKSL